MAKSTEAAEAPKGIQLEPHQVILRPLVTEKGIHRSTRNNAYSFEINKLATKIDVRNAVEALFNVKVVKVCTQTRKGKPRRGKFRMARTREWKKAIVTVDSEQKINFF